MYKFYCYISLFWLYFRFFLSAGHYDPARPKRNNYYIQAAPVKLPVLNHTFGFHFTPDECLCVDESMIPFRGRIIFRQYNKSKRHKYGIKLFKLCTTPGYTTKLEVYGGKTLDSQHNTPTNVVLNLARNYFGKGHTMFVDNWYITICPGNPHLCRQCFDKCH